MATVLYSFRRCPYAIRARLALAVAGLEPGRDLELREVSLKAKPPELLRASSKATVPVLSVAPSPSPSAGEQGGSVLDESLAIMHWALAQADPQRWWAGGDAGEREAIAALINQNDGPFKRHLDRFKYAGHYGEQGLAEQAQHREAALAILRQWNGLLGGSDWLLGHRPSLADAALLPFVRQFRLADPHGFDQAAGLGAVQSWLQRFVASPELNTVLCEPWAPRQPWRSPSWVYHLALSHEWQQAQAAGSYTRSSRGQSLQQVGFIHLSAAHQLNATAARFYADLPAGAVTLLVIDPARLQQLDLSIRWEPAPATGELFPHLYGALPLDAVVHRQPWSPMATA